MNILITGATSGIGREAAIIAANEGHAVTGVGRRADRLRGMENELPRFTGISLDLEDPKCVVELQGAPPQDVLICNAGRGCTTMPLDTKFDLVEEMMRANVLTVMNTLEGCLPKMRSAGNGTVIVVGSVLARVPTAPWRAAYSASKAALAALVAGWRQELRPEGIDVRFLCPGLTTTEFQAAANPSGISLPQLKGPAMQPQTAAEVARVLIDSIAVEKDEIYTRPESAAWMASYYASLAEGKDPLKEALVGSEHSGVGNRHL